MDDKTTKKSKHWWLWLIIAIIVIAVAGVCFWYFSYKIPRDKAIADYNLAVTGFNSAIDDVHAKNQELSDAISTAQNVIDSGNQPYDDTTLSSLSEVLTNAETAKREVPVHLKKLEDTKLKTDDIKLQADDIKSQTAELKEPLDYSDIISKIQEQQKILEDSIQQMLQITNPSKEFVIQRLQNISAISGIQAATEDNDPNENLNKQGGYTAAVFFSSTLINQDEVTGNDILDKGTDCGGCIEVYATKEDAESRNTYLSVFDSAGILNSGSHNVLGTIVIRTSKNLSATQQTELEEAIKDQLLLLQ